MLIKKLSFILSLSLLFQFCGTKYTPEQQKYIQEVEKERTAKNEYMKNSPESPFNYKGKVHFVDLKYYDVDPDFVFRSKIYEYNKKDTVKVFGTKGEERKAVRYGYVKFNFDGKTYKLNVYKGFAKTGQEYYSIWFTDKTTGKETYGVGRYLDIELNNDKDFIYTIDFNLAYNPYCSYSPNYSCAIPTKEDYIPLAVEAGEKNFHK